MQYKDCVAKPPTMEKGEAQTPQRYMHFHIEVR